MSNEISESERVPIYQTEKGNTKTDIYQDTELDKI